MMSINDDSLYTYTANLISMAMHQFFGASALIMRQDGLKTKMGLASIRTLLPIYSFTSRSFFKTHDVFKDYVLNATRFDEKAREVLGLRTRS